MPACGPVVLGRPLRPDLVRPCGWRCLPIGLGEVPLLSAVACWVCVASDGCPAPPCWTSSLAERTPGVWPGRTRVEVLAGYVLSGLNPPDRCDLSPYASFLSPPCVICVHPRRFQFLCRWMTCKTGGCSSCPAFRPAPSWVCGRQYRCCTAGTYPPPPANCPTHYRTLMETVLYLCTR